MFTDLYVDAGLWPALSLAAHMSSSPIMYNFLAIEDWTSEVVDIEMQGICVFLVLGQSILT